MGAFDERAPQTYHRTSHLPENNMNDHRDGTFENTTGHGDEELPPAFTPYEAEYFTVGDGDIVSHDPHLNSDGKPTILYPNCLDPRLHVPLT